VLSLLPELMSETETSTKDERQNSLIGCNVLPVSSQSQTSGFYVVEKFPVYSQHSALTTGLYGYSSTPSKLTRSLTSAVADNSQRMPPQAQSGECTTTDSTSSHPPNLHSKGPDGRGQASTNSLLWPSLIGPGITGLTFYLSARMSNLPTQPALIQGATAGLLTSTTRQVTSSLLSRISFCPKGLASGTGEIAGSLVFGIAQIARFNKMHAESLITHHEKLSLQKQALLGIAGSYIGSKIGVYLFGESGTANLIGSFAGTYAVNKLTT
jgi:hypothetical protein